MILHISTLHIQLFQACRGFLQIIHNNLEWEVIKPTRALDYNGEHKSQTHKHAYFAREPAYHYKPSLSRYQVGFPENSLSNRRSLPYRNMHRTEANSSVLAITNRCSSKPAQAGFPKVIIIVVAFSRFHCFFLFTIPKKNRNLCVVNKTGLSRSHTTLSRRGHHFTEKKT